MKNIFFISVVLLSSFYFTYAQKNQVYYFHNGDRIYLDKIENTKIIHFNNTIEASQKEDICGRLKASHYLIKEITPIIYKIAGNMVHFETDTIILAAQKNGDILSVSDVLISKGKITVKNIFK